MGAASDEKQIASREGAKARRGRAGGNAAFNPKECAMGGVGRKAQRIVAAKHLRAFAPSRENTFGSWRGEGSLEVIARVTVMSTVMFARVTVMFDRVHYLVVAQVEA